LHEVRLDGIFHQDGHCTGATNVIRGDWLPAFAIGNDHATEPTKRITSNKKKDKSAFDNAISRERTTPFPHVGKVVTKGKNGHAFRGHGDVIAGLQFSALFSRSLSNGNVP
jgi:hypothetical protein